MGTQQYLVLAQKLNLLISNRRKWSLLSRKDMIYFLMLIKRNIYLEERRLPFPLKEINLKKAFVY